MRLSWRALNYLFFVSTLLEQTGRGHLTAFTPLLLSDLGLGEAEVGVWTGLLFTITMAVAFPLTPFWGALAERFSRRAVIVRSYYLEAIAYLLCFFAPNIPWLIAARLLLGLTFGNIAMVMATQSLLTPRAKLGSAIALVQSAMPISASLGPPFGAALLPIIGLRGLFLLDAAMAFSSGLLVTFLMVEPASSAPKMTILARARGVVGQMLREPPLRWNFIAALTVRGASATVDNFLPVRVAQVAPGDPATAIGLILGAYGGLTAVATWLVGRVVDRVDETRLFARAMLAATVLTAALALAPNVWLIGAVAVLLAIPSAMSVTVLFAHLARVLPREQQTAVMSLQPLPRTTGALLFPFIAAAVVPLWNGAALAVAALSYAGAALAGRRMVAVTAVRKESSALDDVERT